MSAGLRVCLAGLLCLSLPGLSVGADGRSLALRFSTIDATHNAVISEAVLTEVYARLGFSTQYLALPGRRAIYTSSAGLVDGEVFRVASVGDVWPSLLPVPVPINCLTAAVFSRNEAVEIQGWASLWPYRIGVRRGIVFSREGTRGMDVTMVNKNRQLFTMLVSGRIDVAVLSLVNGLEFTQRSAFSNVHLIQPEVDVVALYHYLHESRRALLPQVTRVLQQLKREGFLVRTRAEYLKRHFGHENEDSQCLALLAPSQ